MMRSALIGIWLLVASVGTASAECAWVLWVVQGIRVDHLYASYKSANECISELDSKEQRLRPDRTVLTTRSAATSLNVTDKVKAAFSTTYESPTPSTRAGPRGK